ncbi:MAG: hypothetical protein A3H32_19095 [Betaproteobacteria bacterium RIFCSPLOWO2_02_FULL_63_19]|nr:MAG: hypothetical protein A3H32_19095 [Betaproteobacteria bacterium RIFCSPLOWO2_02_FULL_63_19]
MKFDRALCFATVIVTALMFNSSAGAADAAEFYRGKTLLFMTPGSPGGGYDTYMREIIPLLEKKTGVTVLPVNEPGGGHLLAVNKTYAAAPDGLTILLTDGEASLLGQLLDAPGARYDLLKMNWIGRVNSEKRVILFTKSSPYKTIVEAAKGSTPLKFGTTGKTDATNIGATLTSHALGIKASIVTGYKGSREFVRAAIQGEVNAICLSESSSKRFSKGGRLTPVTVLARERSELFPDVATIFEQFKLSDDQAWYFDYHEAFAEIGRSIVSGPGVPAERVAYLRKVFAEILNDAEFKKHMAKKRRPISYADAAKLDKSAKAVLGSVSGARKKEIRHIIMDKYFQ